MRKNKISKGLVVVDAHAFVAKPQSSELKKRNVYLVEFCVAALENGFDVFILYNDYDPLHPKRPLPNAQRMARSAIISATEQYVSENRAHSFNPQYLVKKLTGLSDYQRGLRRKNIVKEEKDNQNRAPKRIHPLDLASILVSPHEDSEEKYQNAFGMLFDKYDVYVPLSSIKSYRAFQDLVKNLNKLKALRSERITKVRTEVTDIFDLARDKQTFEFNLDDSVMPIIEGLREQTAISAFLQNAPENEREFASTDKVSREDQMLRSYFAGLARAVKCPAQAVVHQEYASHIFRELEEQGGSQAAREIESAVRDLSPYLRTSKPPRQVF